jgi:hypothetical protein
LLSDWYRSLPVLTHSSAKQLLAANLRCDSDMRCSAFMSETQCSPTHTTIKHWIIRQWCDSDNVTLLHNSETWTVQIRHQYLSGSDVKYTVKDTVTVTL